MSESQPREPAPQVQANVIERFFHCARCMGELPPDQSPREYASLEVGMTAEGAIQVWCKRHDINVAVLLPAQAVLDVEQEMNVARLVCLQCGHRIAPHAAGGCPRCGSDQVGPSQ